MKILLILAISSFFFSCNKTGIADTPASGNGNYAPPSVPLPEKRLNNVSYGPSSFHTMDIFLPQGRSTNLTKVIILIHGGQWIGGDKTDMEGYITILKSRLPDFAFVSINYRLIDGINILMPLPEYDVRLAMEFLWANADAYMISRKTVLLGESAGGNLALLNAFKNGSANLKVVVGIKSPSELTNWYNTAANPQIKPMLEFITGGTPSTLPDLYNAISPINFVTFGDPATLLIHGDGDGFVNTQQSLQLSTKLENFGVFQQLKLLPGEAHAFSLNAQLQVYDFIADFLGNSHLFR